ncbi:MAG: DUF1801 domain-containing protein [Anaerolineae bacterium]|nr:DUF1801 domain-containing protein [Anaerolineae bacterium]
MAENKTKANDKSVQTFLDSIDDDKKRQDSMALLDLMREATGAEPQMWGESIVGFGSYHYKYASGREGDSFLAGFSPRKQALTLYIMAGFDEYDALMRKLGKYKTGKACLYVKKLEDVDVDTLKELVTRSAAHMAKTNPG